MTFPRKTGSPTAIMTVSRRYPQLASLFLAVFLVAVIAGVVLPACAEPAEIAVISAVIPAPYDQYTRLLNALDQYKAIEAAGGWDYIPVGPVLAIGSSGSRVAKLQRRLTIEGDLAPLQAAGNIFDDVLASAVCSFQERNGLATDGRVGLQTLSALNVLVHNRIVQIAANLERWRQMPVDLPKQRLEVNLATASI